MGDSMVGHLNRCVSFLAVTLLTAAPVIRAEEGMWTFDNPPLKQLTAKYNFTSIAGLA